jgi:hypothetical protein
MLAAIATAWLLREGRCRMAEWEKIVLVGLFLLSLNPRSFSEILQLPVGPLVTLGFAAYVVTHVVRARRIAASADDTESQRQDGHPTDAPPEGNQPATRTASAQAV